MSEHEHVWAWDEDMNGVSFLYCVSPDTFECIATLFPDEIKQRVNAHASLTAMVERLLKGGMFYTSDDNQTRTICRLCKAWTWSDEEVQHTKDCPLLEE